MVIKGAMLCDAKQDQKGDVRIDGGKIVAVSKLINPQKNEEVIDAEGLVLMPALIDLNTRVKNNEFNYQNIKKLSTKAFKGGVGFMALVPDCNPPLCSEIEFELMGQSNISLGARVGGLAKASIDGKLTELSTLHKNGALGIFVESELDGNLLKRACEFSLMLKSPIFCHCEDSKLSFGSMNDGELSSKLGIPSISSLSETKEVAKMAEVVRFMGVSAVFQNIASSQGLEILQNAKKSYPNIFIEVSIHHLGLSEDICNGYNTAGKIKPPLKSQNTRSFFLKALKNGKIDLLTSLQSQASIAKKDLAFEQASFGVDCIEHYFSLLYSVLIRECRLPLSDLSKLASYTPAKILNLNKGLIQADMDSDLILVDTKGQEVISQSFSPYHNSLLYGKVVRNFSNIS